MLYNQSKGGLFHEQLWTVLDTLGRGRSSWDRKRGWGVHKTKRTNKRRKKIRSCWGFVVGTVACTPKTLPSISVTLVVTSPHEYSLGIGPGTWWTNRLPQNRTDSTDYELPYSRWNWHVHSLYSSWCLKNFIRQLRSCHFPECHIMICIHTARVYVAILWWFVVTSLFVVPTLSQAYTSVFIEVWLSPCVVLCCVVVLCSPCKWYCVWGVSLECSGRMMGLTH